MKLLDFPRKLTHAKSLNSLTDSLNSEDQTESRKSRETSRRSSRIFHTLKARSVSQNTLKLWQSPVEELTQAFPFLSQEKMVDVLRCCLVDGDTRKLATLDNGRFKNLRKGQLNDTDFNSAIEILSPLANQEQTTLALHYAATKGCLNCVRTLAHASHHVAANVQMSNGATPVYLAAQQGHLSVLKYLVTEAGGSLRISAKDGMAPIHAAAQMGCLNCLQWMIECQGININLRDDDGATPLHYAASRGHAHLVRWMLARGAAIAVDGSGRSAITDAAQNEHIECLALLLQHEAATASDTSEYPDTLPADGEPKSESDYESEPPSPVCVCQDDPDTPPASDADCCATPAPDTATWENAPTPFYLHPPSFPDKSSDGVEPFFLHDPRTLVLDHLRDILFGDNKKTAWSDESESCSELSPNECCTSCCSPEDDGEEEEIYQNVHSPVETRQNESRPTKESENLDGRNPGLEILESLNISEDNEDLNTYSEIETKEEMLENPDVIISTKQKMMPPPPPPPPESIEPQNEPEFRLDVVESEEQQQQQAPSLPKFLVNQKTLQFIPPKFPSPCDSNSLIKPSEYLKLLQGSGNFNSSNLDKSNKRQCGSTSNVMQVILDEIEQNRAATVNSSTEADNDERNGLSSACSLPAISADESRDKHTRGTDNHAAVSTAKPGLLKEPAYGVAQSSLIAELKASRDIHGIRKLKDEKAKEELLHERQQAEEFEKQFSPENFLSKIPELDANGAAIPPWKRLVLARKAAEKTKKEAEQLRQQQLEEKRLKSIPAWKRNIHSKREEPHSPNSQKIASDPDDIKNVTPAPAADNLAPNPWRIQLRKTRSNLDLAS